MLLHRDVLPFNFYVSLLMCLRDNRYKKNNHERKKNPRTMSLVTQRPCGTRKRKQKQPQKVNTTRLSKYTEPDSTTTENKYTETNHEVLDEPDNQHENDQNKNSHNANTPPIEEMAELTGVLTQRVLIEETWCRLSMLTSKELIPCGHCENHFFSFSRLILHQKKRHNIRPFFCVKCDKRFVSRAHLRGHESAIHARIAPYQCEKCGVAFRWQSSAGKHRKICGRPGKDEGT